MPLTHSIDINHSIDTTSSHIEKKQNGGSDFHNAINNINSKLALDNLKVELPKTKEQQEKEVLKLVQIRGLKKSFESGTLTENNCKISKINNEIFSVSGDNGNVMYFVDNKGNIDSGIVNITERPFVKNGKAFEYAGFVEKKENGIYNMYKIERNQEIGPIDINSIDYYNAWQDIIFYADIFNKLATLKIKLKSDKLDIRLFIESGSFKFEDLDLFLDKGLITKEVFDYGIKEIRKKIVSQCSDQRLIKLGIGIKENDLKKYLDKGYIDQDIAFKCYKRLPDNMKNKKKN